MTALAGPDRDQRAQALLKRQVVLTVLALALILSALALLRAYEPGTRVVRVVHDGHTQVHMARRPPTPAVIRLAMAQLALCAVLALVAVGHAARVIAFVFPRKRS
jgi:hypothetical protein